MVYVLSLLALGALLALTVFRPLASGEGYTQIQGEQLLERENEWVVELNIVNQEGQDTEYAIQVVVGVERASEEVRVRAGQNYKYIYHISKDGLEGKEAIFSIYKKGEDKPLETVTYNLK